MAISQPIHLSSRLAVLLAWGCLIGNASANGPDGGSGLQQREAARRSLATMEAGELLRKGDEFYQAGRYAEAVEAYAGAHGMIPDAPASAALRAAATERYVQASVEHAKTLARKGDVPAAKAAVERVLAPDVAPGDLLATLALANLNDPIRTNPALTAEHARDVDQVRRLLYAAEGAYNLGKFDEANQQYQRVLKIDPTNSAARRGMERVAAAKSGYHNAAYDQTRAEMLKDVAAGWEMQIQAPDFQPDFADLPPPPGELTSIPVYNKLSRIIIPSIRLEQSTLDEAVELLRVRAAELDTLETDSARKGVNFKVDVGDPASEAAKTILTRRFDLQLGQVPLSEVLRYLGDLTGTSYTTDDYSVIIRPLGSVSDEMVTRSYRVPPDFLSNLNADIGEGAAADDPFAEPAGREGLLARRMGVQEALARQGVNFPEGALATLSPATNILRVTNTPLNQDMIQQVVDAIAQTEPVSVAVRVTMIRVEQTRLEELGFDWLLENFKLAGGGGDFLNLSGGTQGNGGDLADIPLATGATKRNPLTAGNRSGDEAITGDAIKSLLENSTQGFQTASRAPGILSVNGYINNTTAQMLMRGLDQKKGVDMMIHPSTVTRSGQASSIHMVKEFIYPTEYDPPEIPQQVGLGGGQGASTPVTPANPTAFDKRDVGVILDVLPVADANRQYIDLTLKPFFSDLLGFVNYGSPINSIVRGTLGDESVEITDNAILMPVFSTHRLSTQVTVADGSTIVLGGLMQQRVQNVQDQTPVLGSIPIIGRLFQSKAMESSSTAIIFLVNVELLDPTGRPYRSR